MQVVRMSFPALLWALLLIAGFHLLSAVPDLATDPLKIVTVLVRQLALQAVLLLIVHGIARLLRISSSYGYAAMGAALNYLLQSIITAPIFLLHTPFHHLPATYVLLPLLAAGAAFLYARLAGTDTRPDTLTLSAGDGAPVPLRVRTSKLAILMMAMVPAFVAMLCTALFMMNINGMFSGTVPKLFATWVRMLAVPAYVSMVALIMTGLPAALVVGATHIVARAMHRAGGSDYAAIGEGLILFAPEAAWCITQLPMLAILPLAPIVGALMGGCYRRIAGLEPVPLPEAVRVADPAVLVQPTIRCAGCMR